jgi:nucleotide-binding universal stress UspA family protein
MAEKVLIPLDGTEYAEQVIPLIEEIAAKAGMSIELVSIVNPADLDVIETAGEGELTSHDISSTGLSGMHVSRASGGSTGMVWVTPAGSPEELTEEESKALDEANRLARDYLYRIQGRLASRRIEVNSNVEFGDPDTQIVETAIKRGATMIAMTARSKHFWERGMLGSTADRVIHGSPMPVLLFKPMEGLAEAVSVAPDTIVIGVDGSPQAEQGIAPAAQFAQSVQAGLALVHVLKRDEGSRREAALKYIEALAQTRAPGAQTHISAGAADDEIILYADEFEHPVIALTNHGGFSVGRWFRGSTTDKVVRNAGYPVIIIPVRS